MTPYDYKKIYESDEFKRESIKAGKKWGACYSPEKTVFRVWAPMAQSVSVCLYKTGSDGEGGAETLPCAEMLKVASSTYECTIRGNLDGIYYTYKIKRDDTYQECVDPYARACGVNGLRGMIADLSKTNPAQWKKDEKWVQKNKSTLIYELHVKDFSWDENSGIRKEYRGKYMAFTEDETSFKGLATGVSHLKEMGVTHVHLLPVFDFATVDETKDGQDFNWGYDPANYNVPEGSYATNPYDGHVRIREFKEMVKALHEAEIAVVMDVVYNHTYEFNGAFQILAPFYYYRQNEDGSLSDGSACGNETASERYLVSTFIKESVLYWAEEYHIDGFRFDLMGLHDTCTMNRIRQELDERFPDKPILLYGEPWTAQASPMESGFYPAVKKNISLLDNGIAIFSDDTRDAIKGSVFYGEEPGFVNGAHNMESKIASAVQAWCDGGHEFSPLSPAQIINYVSVHDNFTLWDKLIQTAGMEDYESKPANILRENKLAAGIVLFSMGTPLFQAGEEFARTKKGDHNSYHSTPSVNQLDWNRRVVFDDLVKYYQGLIALRGEIPFYQDKSMDALYHISIHRQEKNMVSFLIDHACYKKSRWKQIFVCFNAGKQGEQLELPKGKWQVLLDEKSSFLWKKEHLFNKVNIVEKEVSISAVSMLILGSSEQI